MGIHTKLSKEQISDVCNHWDMELQSFSETEAMYENFSSLKLDMTSLKLTIPIDAEFPYKFKVGGYGTYSNVEELTFEGEILLIEY